MYNECIARTPVGVSIYLLCARGTLFSLFFFFLFFSFLLFLSFSFFFFLFLFLSAFVQVYLNRFIVNQSVFVMDQLCDN